MRSMKRGAPCGFPKWAVATRTSFPPWFGQREGWRQIAIAPLGKAAFGGLAQMIRIIVFNLLYAGTCAFTWWRGGKPERFAMVVLIADFQLSHWAIRPLVSRYSGVEHAMLAVDLAAFLAIYAMSLFSSRYWPIWMAALQACVVAGHINGLRPDVVPFAYGNIVALWSYMLLGMLIVATIRHQRRIARYGDDPSWRWELSEDYRKGGLVDADDLHTDSRSRTGIFRPIAER
eukprot:TRINITY_DN7255_c0_g1_i2.p2 TRINITY_DN7255_c0_g1~~TRINITY_DN7255_c0_g1_i2.p2  ORF type:complete len:231 (+),score=25.71 TRINITY_DN7255_c0_g1_i2:862-1554(+)